MEHEAATLYCPNDLCQAPNPINNKFCQQCRTRLSKRYLYALTNGQSLGNAGELLADRYLIINQSIVLDTTPALLPQVPAPVSAEVVRPYLRLIPYRLHLPQAYGTVPFTFGDVDTEVLLLEGAPIYAEGRATEGQLIPSLASVWAKASSMRQLNWLWQMACLWQPLASEGVASSLLTPHLLRAEGSLVRLLELRPDGVSTPSLADLGELWRQWVPMCQGAIADFVAEVCQELRQGEIYSSEQLVAVLDQGLTALGKSQKNKIAIATKSDTGPSRQRNEDACYPANGTILCKPPQAEALVIVCDGIGGHEGGNVASNLAIQTIHASVQQLANIAPEHVDPTLLLADLELAASTANDRISQQNDKEQRHGRQRMGTTVVMGLAIAHEIYIAHVGDSRAYRITRSGCHQITLDDDVASREVRLGYAMYRDAVQQLSSGSLVQALGMNPSASLHPTAQRFIVDEDSVFLLCSDGLSDFDRVEQYWESEILPVLDGKIDVGTASQRLVELANTINGHDNVTVGLLHYQVKFTEPETKIAVPVAELAAITSSSYAATAAIVPQPRPATPATAVPTQILQSPQRKKSRLPLLLTILSLLGISGGAIAYLWQQGLLNSSLPIAANPSVPVSPPAAPVPAATDTSRSAVGKLLLTKTQIRLQSAPSNDPVPEGNFAPVAAGSVVQVLEKQPVTSSVSSTDYWLHLQVCSVGNISATPKPRAAVTNNKPLNATPKPKTVVTIKKPPTPTTAPPPPVVLPVGAKGWISWSTMQPHIDTTASSAIATDCNALPAAVSPQIIPTPAAGSTSSINDSN